MVLSWSIVDYMSRKKGDFLLHEFSRAFFVEKIMDQKLRQKIIIEVEGEDMTTTADIIFLNEGAEMG